MGTVVSANRTDGGLRFLVNRTAADFAGKIPKAEFMHHVATLDSDTLHRSSSNLISPPLSQKQKSSAYRLRGRAHDGICRWSW